MKPYWQDRDDLARLYHGDVRTVLSQLPAKSVQCVITSPPYWGLRDYGTGTWEGGDANCDHKGKPHSTRTGFNERYFGRPSSDGNKQDSVTEPFKGNCPKCGARRIDQQIGSEPSPDCGTQGQAQCGKCFVCVMVAVFREVRRVLRDDGTLWLNLGDSYNANVGSGFNTNARNGYTNKRAISGTYKGDTGLAAGNLVGVPWRVALALQADGWVLRQDIIWHKASPMPESVQNRCTKSHEYVFLLTKGMGYYYDAEAIKEHDAAHKPKPKYQQRKKYNARLRNGFLNTVGDPVVTHDDEILANKRSVWTLANEPYHGAHYATFPSLLVEPMILAGSSQKGCCPHCQTPWQRHTEEIQVKRPRPNDYTKRTGEPGTGNSCANSVAGTKVRTLGWRPSCDCEDHQPVPCTILDPFAGSATTLAVAVAQGRRGWGIELNDKYLDENAIPRVKSALALIR